MKVSVLSRGLALSLLSGLGQQVLWEVGTEQLAHPGPGVSAEWQPLRRTLTWGIP